jgi:hypothetical protein
VCVAIVGLALGLATKQGVARRTLLFSLVAIVGLAGVAAALALGWSSYVPRKTGSARFVLEETLLVGPFVACGVACLMRLLGRRSGRTWRRGVSVTVVAVSCALGLVYSAQHEAGLETIRPLASDVTSLRSLGVPADSVVLTNAWTEAYVPQVMGARGLLDGRAPYTYPRVLVRANRLLREAHTYFQHPCRHIDFLDRNHVSYVVVTQRGTYALGTRNLVAKRVSRTRLDDCSALTRVKSTRRLAVYRVEG